MNIYRHRFTATCPNNGIPIRYRFELRAPDMVPVERITDACAGFVTGYHERIADTLHLMLGGSQILTARHHGVLIQTIRG